MWWLLKLTIVLQCVNSVRIINVRVPDVIQYGSRDAVTLDCDYVVDNVTGLVVKWFFMDKSQPVYQWIPPQRPQALGILKNKVDLKHKVSQNPYTQHRALRITSLGTELTGNYTCVVSTFFAEDQRTRPMTIFVPERKFYMILDRVDHEWLNIICSADGVFPKPDITIMAGNRLLANMKTSVNYIDGRYSALASVFVKVDALPTTVEIMCEIQVPLANYISRKRDIFYRDPPPTPESSVPDTQASPDIGHTIASAPELVFATIFACLFLRHWNYRSF